MLQTEREVGLAHLLGRWMSGSALQRAMLNAGINIFVNEHTDKYVSSCSKVCICYLLACRIEGRQDKFGLMWFSMLCWMDKPGLNHLLTCLCKTYWKWKIKSISEVGDI